MNQRVWICGIWLAMGCRGKDSGTDSANTPALGGPASGVTDGGAFRVSYSSAPTPIPLTEDFVLLTYVTDASGAVVDGAELVVNATMPSHDHGMATVPTTTALGGGQFETVGMLFQMTGDWEITFQVSANGTTETAAIPYRCCIVEE